MILIKLIKVNNKWAFSVFVSFNYSPSFQSMALLHKKIVSADLSMQIC